MGLPGRFLQKDLLARAMTRSTQIGGVPFQFALYNIALFVLLGIVFYLISAKGISLVIALGCMGLSHLLMMIISLQEEKALVLLLANAGLCKTTPFSGAHSYSPLTTTVKIKKAAENPVSRHLPWTHLHDEHTVMTKRGDLIQVLTLEGIGADTLDESVIDEAKALRNRFLYQLAKADLAVSFYLIKRPAEVLTHGDYPEGYSRAFNARYQAALAHQARFQNRLYVVLMLKAPPFRKKNPAAAGMLTRLDTLNEASARFISLYKECHCRRLGQVSATSANSELLSFLAELINLEQRPVRKPLGALNEVLPRTTAHFARRRGLIQVQGADGRSRFAAMLSLKEYPEETHACLLDTLLKAPCELIVCQSFLFKAKPQALRELTKQQRKMAQTDDSVRLADALLLAVEEVKAGQAAYGEHHLSLCVVADDLQSLQEAIHDLESRLNQEAGLITVREEANVELAFWAQLPGNQAYRIRQSLISSLNVAGFASLHATPEGKAFGNHWGEAFTVLETAAGTPYYFSLHVGEVGNAIFIGPMGGGKTLMLSALLAFSMKFGGWRFVFDKDRSMEVLVRALEGSYHLIKPGQPSGMAPLSLPDTAENRAFNQLLLKQLLSVAGVLSSQESKCIEEAVAGIYELEPALRQYRHLAPFFGVSEPGSLRERFDRFHSDGQYAWVFDNASDAFTVSSQLTGHDIGKLLRPAFAAVSTAVLMYLFHRLGECLDSSPTLVLIPEGWKALKDPFFQEQLEDWSRTPRKNNMALVMDTQNPEELAKSAAGSAIAREARTQVYFAHSEARWADYRQFNLSEREFEIIKEVLPSMGGYFFLLKQGGRSVIARLHLSGMDADLRILSSNLARAYLLDAIRKETGDNPHDWLPAYERLSLVLLRDYGNDFSRLKPQFERLWEQYR